MNLSLKTKIVAGFAGMIGLILIFGVLSYVYIGKVSNELFTITNWKVPAVKNAVAVHAMAYEATIDQKDYLLKEKDETFAEAMKNLDTLNLNLDAVDKVGNEYKDTALLDQSKKVRDITKNFRELYQKGVAGLKDNKKAVQEMISTGENVGEQAKNFLQMQVDDYTAAMQSGNKNLDQYVQRYIVTSKIQALALTIRMHEKEERMHKDRKYYEIMKGQMKELMALYDELQGITQKGAQIKMIETARKATKDYADAAAAWIKNDDVLAIEILPAMDKGATEARKLAAEAETAGWVSADVSKKNAETIITTATTIIIGFGIIAVILGMVLGLFLSNSIANPVRKIAEALASSSRQIGSATAQLASAASELSSSSNEQASSIQETSSSLEEMSGMVKSNETNAQQAFDLANKVRDNAASGNETMTQLQQAMTEILKSNEKIEQLVKVIGNIGEKTQVMDEIVFQTKLLSFNASVEAERAGEHGRGFAVVAQEVGNLAQMSGKSAQEIAEIVKNSIREAEAITNENKKKVEQGNVFVHETAKNLKEILSSAGTVSAGAKQVLDASREQSKGIEQINIAMKEVDTSTQQNSATAEETASTSEELSSQVLAMNSAMAELTKLIEGRATVETDSQHQAQQQHHGTRSHTETQPRASKVIELAKEKGKTRKAKATASQHEQSAQEPLAKAVGDDKWENL